MGVVLEAMDLRLGQPVAIKLLRLEWCTPELEARFEREARVAAQLPPSTSPASPTSGTPKPGTPFLVMELLLGRDLLHRDRQRGTFPIAEAVELILQATAGVAAAHAAALVHRDLKPANLFLVGRPEGVLVKVLDFGLSKEPLREGDTALTRTTTTFGTPQYMSPEQFQSAKHVDARSDQHALAMILFELPHGRAAVRQRHRDQPDDRHRHRACAFGGALRPDIPPELEAAITRALAKLPDERFADVLGFARALEPFAGSRARAMMDSIATALDPLSAGAPPAASDTQDDEVKTTRLPPQTSVDADGDRVTRRSPSGHRTRP